MSAGWRGDISEREAEVLAAIGEHQTNAQIASSLHISVRTVETHVSSLLRKFGVPDRRALAASADQMQTRASARPGRFVDVPASRTSFVGRERDRETGRSALEQSRLVSLLGPGGVGKTRLAVVVAEVAAPSFASGGAFVDLVPAREGTVVQTIAGVLGVTERPPEPLEQAVIARLRLGPSLLVLDSCEHVMDEVSSLVERVLAACPEATVLATSRERLGVPGERTIQVLPLPTSDAERLFRERASAVDSGFTADSSVVTELCARLDGMPLAIELAAARAPSLGPDGLLTAIEDRLRLVAGGRGVARRHRSLRSVIRWSHDLLDSDERALFRRLSVFVGGFDLDAAAATVPSHRRSVVADVIGRLVDKSLLVHRADDSRSRWRMLETIRAFAADQLLATDEQEEARRLHLHWAASKAAEIEARITGDWLVELDEVIDDLRAALAATTAGPDGTAHQLARSLAHLTFARRFFLEAQGHYQAASERAEDPSAAYQDLRSAADTALAVTDGQTAIQLLLDASELARSASDGNAQALALASAVIIPDRFLAGNVPDMVSGRSNALLREATEAAADRDEPRVAAVLAAARAWDRGHGYQTPDLALSRVAVDAARRAGDPVLVVGALDALATATATRGRWREAHSIASERLQLADALPRHDPYAAAEVVDAFHTASRCAIATGDLPTALGLVGRAVADDPIGDQYLSTPKLVRALALTGRFDEALQHASELWGAWRRAGSPPTDWMSTAVMAAALVHGLRGHDHHHDLWRSRALEIAGVDDATESPYLTSFAAFVDARVAQHLGRLQDAAALVERAWTSPDPWYQGYARTAAAELAVVAGLPDAAERLTDSATVAAENKWAAACLARAAGRLHGDPDAITDAIDRWERIDARFERACTLLLLPGRAHEGHAELRVLACPAPAC